MNAPEPRIAMRAEQALTFDCQGESLVGILHPPAPGNAARKRGIVIVVGGGPQYRAGGHRQLTLWSRRLAEEGYPVLRFDYRGMGDAHGEFLGFQHVDDDICAAIDTLQRALPEVDEVVLWGECDASSAILLYAHRDTRVKGVVLLNPWVRTEAVAAKAILRFYYLQRLMQPSFWKKLASGKFNPFKSLRSLWSLWLQSRIARPSTGAAVPAAALSLGAPVPRDLPLPDGMLMGLQRFAGPLMLVMSGRDLIAREFDVLIGGSSAWQAALGRNGTKRHDMPDGDHTFSSARQRGQVLAWGLDWLRSW
jgi:exosortase A-associated hydrolase 1